VAAARPEGVVPRRGLRQRIRVSIAALLFLSLAARAHADVCVTTDEARDTFSARDRAAALLLLTRQFELAGERVVAPGCPIAYTVAHVQLGQLIAVTLSGPNGERDAVAVGMDDVPAVYGQMVRSLVRGVPMGARGIVDRTNVSTSQATARRVHSDSVAYARLGYGGIFGDRIYGGPSVGIFGYRHELDAFAIDVSLLNLQFQSSSASGYATGSGGMTGAWLKLEALRFVTPLAAGSPYFGGGLSWSIANLDHAGRQWSGSGLQGELTVGYEFERASSIRVFVQADAGLPFYTLHSETYSYSRSYPYVHLVSADHRYAPSLSFSLGFGWQRGRR
jgi:hypothetical protein